MIHKGTFDYRVDAKHFNFMWTGPMYITVSYVASNEGDKITVSIDNISAAPYLVNSVVLHGNWWTVDKELMSAAQSHAEKEFARNAQVNPTILQALRPHI